MVSFSYNLDYKNLNLRRKKSLYRVGKGEQGVLLVEPYKSEILPHWKFCTPQIARISATAIFKLFQTYKKKNDFIGMDMSRKFLQMGYTRSRRYANHKTGQKYVGAVPKRLRGQSGAHGRPVAKQDPDPVKAKSAEIFFKYWKRAEKDKIYTLLKSEWKKKYG